MKRHKEGRGGWCLEVEEKRNRNGRRDRVWGGQDRGGKGVRMGVRKTREMKN